MAGKQCRIQCHLASATWPLLFHGQKFLSWDEPLAPLDMSLDFFGFPVMRCQDAHLGGV